ncbi:MAG TPA: hypothetical protein VNL74_10015 [Methylococcus sp.]|nr:hypothetical protein [Methylococcus sp.]
MRAKWTGESHLIMLLGGMLLLRAGVGFPEDRADPPEPVAQPEAQRTAGVSTGFEVRVSPERQELAGIVTQRLEPAFHQPEIRAQARVLDIQPLLSLRARYHAAETEIRVTEAALRLARKNRDRLAGLHNEAIIATRQLLEAESHYAQDAARAEEARRHSREIREAILQDWGPELFRLATADRSPLFEELLQRRRVLLVVTVSGHGPGSAPAAGDPPSAAATDRRMPHSILVARDGDRTRARPASLVAPAPRTDDFVQGETYFFHTDGEGLRVGMRVDAWIPVAEAKLPGVFLPVTAVVWHDGRAWAYVRQGPERFLRRELRGYQDRGGDWFVPSGLHPGEAVVIRGAQTLLSEEQRGAIPEEEDG